VSPSVRSAEALLWLGQTDLAEAQLDGETGPEATRMKAIAALYREDMDSATTLLREGTRQGDEVCRVLLEQLEAGTYTPLRTAASASAS
jgi:hypothetical protein